MQKGTPGDILLSASEWMSERVHMKSERVPVEADPRGFMSKRLKAALVSNRRPLDSLSHSYTPAD